MAAPKQAHALTTFFGKKYKEKYGRDAKFNRYSARWGFDSILMDMSAKEVEGLIEFYFGTVSPNGHTLDWFFYNYDKLAASKVKTDEDREAQRIIREETRKRAEEWRKKTSGED